VVLPVLAELRRSGIAADLDYAGRSFKGQMTQAGRTGAATVVIVGADGATIRRGGRDEQTVPLADLVATLGA
jgi:histidyl-tRNA synthetase